MSDKERQTEPCGVSVSSQRERVAQRTNLSTADSVPLIPRTLLSRLCRALQFRSIDKEIQFIICIVLITNEVHNSYNQFLFHSFLSVLHISKESCRSSSGARHNILYYTVYYAVLLMMNDYIRSKHVEETKTVE